MAVGCRGTCHEENPPEWSQGVGYAEIMFNFMAWPLGTASILWANGVSGQILPILLTSYQKILSIPIL